MPADDKFTAETILWIRPWAPNLLSFRLTRDAAFRFTPGQFARLGVLKPDPGNPKNPSGRRIVWRAYSVVSAGDDPFLEFYSIVIPGGEFTGELARLREGATVFVDRTNYGFFTLDRFTGGRDLWMLASGTGLAPFLSMLWEPRTWQAYEHLIVVHSVRYPNELAYADTLAAFGAHPRFAAWGQRLRTVPTVTRGEAGGMLDQRIPALIGNGRLEAAAGVPLDLEHSRIMICGNPEMVDDTRKLLVLRGFATARRNRPGQLAAESYW